MEVFKIVHFAVNLLLLVSTGETNDVTIVHLEIGDHHRMSMSPTSNYSFIIVPSTPNYSQFSAFTFQLHTQSTVLSLYNGSENCLKSAECVTTGSSVSMVQFLESVAGRSYTFKAIIHCLKTICQTNVRVLVAVVGVEMNHPIPGGCAHTSNLINDAELSLVLMHNSKQLIFQDSNVGYDSFKSGGPLACDFNKTMVIDRMEYFVYRYCLPAYDFGFDTFFDAIEEMLSPEPAGLIQMSLGGGDIKKVLFGSTPRAGEVYNVIVRDSILKTKSAYVPVVSYGCQLGVSGSCDMSIPVMNIILGLLIGLAGFFLSFFANRLFHLEVFVFPALILAYLFYMLLSSVTEWSHTAIAGGSVGLGTAVSLLFYTVWFFSGFYYVYILLFGISADFLVTATILFTPAGTLFTILEINYVYALVLCCGCVVFMVIFVAFPRVLNIVSSSLVGSYAIVFCVGMFKRTILTRIILRIVDNASVPGFLSSPSKCQLETIDIVLSAIWGCLFLLGVTTQCLLAVQHKKAFKKQHVECKADSMNYQTLYHPFPSSPYKTLRTLFNRKKESTQPLLSPNTKMYGSVN